MDLETGQVEERVKTLVIQGDDVEVDTQVEMDEETFSERERALMLNKEEEARLNERQSEIGLERREQLEDRLEIVMKRLLSEEAQFKKSLKGFFTQKWNRILDDIQDHERKMVLKQEAVLEELQGDFNRALEHHLEREGQIKQRELSQKKELAIFEGCHFLQSL